MDIGSLFLIFGLLLLVGLFVARPLLENRSISIGRSDHEHSALLAERERVLTALEELDFDFTLGKVPDEDYPEQRSMLLQRGAEVLRQLDGLATGASIKDPMEARIEAAIAARKSERQRGPEPDEAEIVRPEPEPVGAPVAAASLPKSPARRLASNGDDEVETLIASRRRERSEKAAGFCPQCGSPVQKSDHFCPKCGASLVA